jgi:hypothetical protein
MKTNNEGPKPSKREMIKSFFKGAKDEVKGVLASKDKPTLIQKVKKSEKVQKLVSIGLGAALTAHAAIQGVNVADAMNTKYRLEADSANAIAEVQKAQSNIETMQSLVNNFDQTPAGAEVKKAIETILKSDFDSEALRYNNKLKDIQKLISDFNKKPLSEYTIKATPGMKKVTLPDYGGTNSTNYRMPGHAYGQNTETGIEYEKIFTAIQESKKIKPESNIQASLLEELKATKLSVNDSKNSVSIRNLLGRLNNGGPEFQAMTPDVQAEFKSFWNALGGVEDTSFLAKLKDNQAMIDTTNQKMGPGLKEKRDTGLLSIGAELGIGGVLASQIMKKKRKDGANEQVSGEGEEIDAVSNTQDGYLEQSESSTAESFEPIVGELDELNAGDQDPEIGVVFETSDAVLTEQDDDAQKEPTINISDNPTAKKTIKQGSTQPLNRNKLGLAVAGIGISAAAAFAGPNIKGIIPNIQSLASQPEAITHVESTKKAEYKSFQELLTPENTATFKTIIRNFIDTSFTNPKEHNEIMADVESQFSQEGFDLSQSDIAKSAIGNIASSSNVPFYSSLTPKEQDLVNWYNAFEFKTRTSSSSSN